MDDRVGCDQAVPAHFPIEADVEGQSPESVVAVGDADEGAKLFGSLEKFVPEAIESELGAAAYIAVKDGGEEPYTTCPSCGEDTYVLEDEMRCALCGEEANHECALCGCAIPASELGGSMCGYCDHMMSKDD